MAYRFPLATVLRLREIAEEKEERLLAQIVHRVVLTKTNLADIAVRREQVMRERESSLKSNLSAAGLQSFYGQLEALELAKQQAEEQLQKLEVLRVQQMTIYSLAHRNRQLLDDMHVQQRGVYDAQRTRAEQKVMDDNFASRLRR